MHRSQQGGGCARGAPAVDAKVLGARFPAERVMVREVIDGWAKLDASTKDKEMWVLVDGSAYGMGTLLERTAAGEAAGEAAREAAGEAAAVEAPPVQLEGGGTGEDDDSDFALWRLREG